MKAPICKNDIEHLCRPQQPRSSIVMRSKHTAVIATMNVTAAGQAFLELTQGERHTFGPLAPADLATLACNLLNNLRDYWRSGGDPVDRGDLARLDLEQGRSGIALTAILDLVTRMAFEADEDRRLNMSQEIAALATQLAEAHDCLIGGGQ